MGMASSERHEFLTLIGELKQRVEALEKAQGVDVSGLVERVEKLEAKRGPGRPPKQAD